ncbi:MAG: alpha/beta hydrolase, partial [Chloroflexi bacterium]|nr:alpha/beta hydrolase [Chloroflexota bacterium]
ISAGGINWHYLEWGDRGPALVLWHGITSSARSWWAVGPFLAGIGFHVFAPDLPGHGQTSDSPNGYAIETTARLLDSWLAALGFDSPIVLGHSWGGINALVYATLPEAQVRPRAVVLEDPVIMLGADAEAYLPNFTAGIGMQRTEAAIAELVAANPRWHECDVWWKIEALQQVRRSAVEGFFRDNAAINVVERLREIDVPAQILVADPEFGSIWKAEHLALVNGLVPSSVGVEVIEGSSHNIHRDTFAPFSMALGVFVRQFLKSRS